MNHGNGVGWKIITAENPYFGALCTLQLTQ